MDGEEEMTKEWGSLRDPQNGLQIGPGVRRKIDTIQRDEEVEN
jgi:hypothetical protein